MVSYEQIYSKQMLENLQKSMLSEDKFFVDTIYDKLVKKQQHDAVKTSDHAYLDPTENKVFVGESMLPNGRRVPNFRTPVRDMTIYNELKKLGKYRSSYLDRAKYDSFEDEYVEDFKEYDSLMNKISKGQMNYRQAQVVSAGVMQMADFSGLRLIDILGTVQDLQEKTYSLQNAGTKQNSNQLLFRVPTTARFQIATELGEHETVEAMQMSFSAEIYQLKKDMAHIAWSDEFELAGSFDVPVMPMTMQNAVSDFDRVRAAKVATQVLAGAATTPPFKWDTFVTAVDRSERNPAYDFQIHRTAIDTAGGYLDEGAMSSLTLLVYLSNTYVNGQLSSAPESNIPYTGIVQLPKQAGLTIYVDRNIPDGFIPLWASAGLYNVQSLIKTSTYREEHVGGNGIYIRNWNGAFIIQPTRAKVISSALTGT
jgi:hypothetical protein